MSNESKAYIHSATNILVHVPELVRYGSKCHREVEDSGESFLHALNKNLRSFKEVVSYPPNQAFIGNLKPIFSKRLLLCFRFLNWKKLYFDFNIEISCVFNDE